MAVLHLTERGVTANGTAVRAELENRLERSIPRGSIYVTLDRLEDKKMLTSREVAPARPDRRPKRVFRVTPAGVRAAREAVSMLTTMQRGLGPLMERS
jgi:DNA-binding PadR family transcriptional regulator